MPKPQNDPIIDTIVSVPARNEEDRIDRCLAALASQRSSDGRTVKLGRVQVQVLVNNSHDNTAAVARTWAERSALDVQVRTLDLPSEHAHAGGARRAAMEWAAASLSARGGYICSTDADSQVAPTWLAELWRAFEAGADAVAGVVAFDPSRARAPFSAARQLEDHYAALQAELTARLDPLTHDPWPNHIWTWGANLAVTREAYRAVGGMPAQPLAEDRAFAERLMQQDFKMRHSLEVKVITSGRDEGRAPGGLADLIRTYAADDTYPCDAALEPVQTTVIRASARRQLRLLKSGQAQDLEDLAQALGLELHVVEQALELARFGERWSSLERASEKLVRRRLSPSELPHEIVEAETRLQTLRALSGAPPTDNGGFAGAGLWTGKAEIAQ